MPSWEEVRNGIVVCALAVLEVGDDDGGGTARVFGGPFATASVLSGGGSCSTDDSRLLSASPFWLSTVALMCGGTRTQTNVLSCVTQPSRSSQARMFIKASL